MTITIVRKAAVSLVYNDQRHLLVVWNRRYHGWTLPGGLVEEGESIEDAQMRELREETGLATITAKLIYNAPVVNGPKAIERPRPGRASHAFVFLVTVPENSAPKEMEEGCPIMWVSRDEFLTKSPFREFYTTMFDTLKLADEIEGAL